MSAWKILFGVLLFVSFSRSADSVQHDFEVADVLEDPNNQETKQKVRELEAEEAALYEKKKALIDKVLREIKNVAKEIRPDLNATDLGADAQFSTTTDAQVFSQEALIVGR